MLPESSPGSWVTVKQALCRCPAGGLPSSVKPANGAAIVLLEIFGPNQWVGGVADRFSATDVTALAMPLLALTAPALDLS